MGQDHHIIPAELWGSRDENCNDFIPELYHLKESGPFTFECENNHITLSYHKGSHPYYTSAVRDRIKVLISLDTRGPNFDYSLFAFQLSSMAARLKDYLSSWNGYDLNLWTMLYSTVKKVKKDSMMRLRGLIRNHMKQTPILLPIHIQEADRQNAPHGEYNSNKNNTKIDNDSPYPEI